MNSVQFLSKLSYSRKKHILYGTVIAILLFGVSISISVLYDTFYISPNQTNQETNIEGWDYTSPQSLALSLQSNLGDLIYLQVNVFELSEPQENIDDSWGKTRLEFFDFNVMGFTLSIMIDSDEPISITHGSDEWLQGEWRLSYDQMHSLENFILLGQDITSSHFSNFYDSVEEDFGNLDEFIDVTDQVDDRLVKMRGNIGAVHWEIMQVFSDGSSIKIESYGNEILVSHLFVSHFLQENDGFIIFFDNDYSSPLHLESKFHGITQNNIPFAKFLETSNVFLNSVIG